MHNDVARSRRRRVGAAVAATVAAFVAFASLGGVGLAHGVISLAQYQYSGQKVTVCHKGKNTITISTNALAAHLRHGDTLGKCQNGHTSNRGKHKGESHHSANPATGTGGSEAPGGAATHGNGHGHGNGNGHNK